MVAMAVIAGSPFSDLIVRGGRSPVGVLRSAIVRNGRSLAPRNVVTPIRNGAAPANGHGLDWKRCDRARVVRDARLDGRFFTGVHQMGGPFGHPPPPAARTPPAPLARKRHQVLAPTALAPEPRHAVLEHAARQELPELER